jgi:hydroxyethylthiazole kinase-like uncharacterized protein yjeF
MQDRPGLSRAELARIDLLAVEEYGLPGAVLMENAGRGAAEEVLRLLRERGGAERSSFVAVFAGPGNNGGDACVVARHLANAGVVVELFAAAAPARLRGDAATMRGAVDRMGIPVHDAAEERAAALVRTRLAEAAIVVDGLLGTGFEGEVRPAIARLIEAVNERRRSGGARTVALDLPSGLDADTGRAARPTVVADLTVTFVARKLGFDAPEAKPYLGEVVVGSIGAPAALVERVRAGRLG